MYFVGYIYKITNKLNGKQYIGQTVNPFKRWSRHKSNKEKTAISHAIAKYGCENFSFYIESEYYSETQLNDAEDYFIQFYNTLSPNGYNRVIGAQKNRVWSEESLKKASDSKKGPKNPRYGKFGPIHTEASKLKLRNSRLGKKPSTMCKIICVELNQIFNSMVEAAKVLKLKPHKISLVCSGRRKSTGGFTFKKVV